MSQDYHIFVSSLNAQYNNDNQEFKVDIPTFDTGRSAHTHNVALEFVAFKNTNKTIDRTKRYIFFSENVINDLRLATIPDGYYTSATFPQAVQDAMNAASTLGSPYTVAYDSLSGKLNINISGGNFFALRPIANDAYHEMGFTSNGIDLGLQTDYLSDGVMDLSGPECLVIECSMLDRYGINSVVPQAFATIPLRVDNGFLEVHTQDNFVWKQIPSQNVRFMTIRLYDNYARPFLLAANSYVSINFILRPTQ